MIFRKCFASPDSSSPLTVASRLAVFLFVFSGSIFLPSAWAAPIRVTRWTKPMGGWIYVLDYNNHLEKSQVLLLDPSDGKVKGVVESGSYPQIILSPDGSRLYILSGMPASLAILDTE